MWRRPEASAFIWHAFEARNRGLQVRRRVRAWPGLLLAGMVPPREGQRDVMRLRGLMLREEPCCAAEQRSRRRGGRL